MSLSSTPRQSRTIYANRSPISSGSQAMLKMQMRLNSEEITALVEKNDEIKKENNKLKQKRDLLMEEIKKENLMRKTELKEMKLKHDMRVADAVNTYAEKKSKMIEQMHQDRVAKLSKFSNILKSVKEIKNSMENIIKDAESHVHKQSTIVHNNVESYTKKYQISNPLYGLKKVETALEKSYDGIISSKLSEVELKPKVEIEETLVFEEPEYYESNYSESIVDVSIQKEEPQSFIYVPTYVIKAHQWIKSFF